VKRVNASDRNGDRLDSWKEIAAYLKRGARTVQRWEREEGLPVHRLVHNKLGSVYAYRSELDAWWFSHADTREIMWRRAGRPIEGSVRRSGDQLRIVVQLADAESVLRALEAALSSATGATLC
jgi:hypothetical protein